ncbi:MAG TPA: antibiotic biosynthesis monooxygenase [Solirubrobacterales bacterium]|jgi:quinol monooxygenase YgiN
MDKVARYGKAKAKPGRGDELARMLLKAADDMRSEPACELYLVNRQADDPDTVWVTELWRSREDLDRVVAGLRGSADVAAVMELVEDFQVIELDLLGGVGA